jgi:hypothetical protein
MACVVDGTRYLVFGLGGARILSWIAPTGTVFSLEGDAPPTLNAEVDHVLVAIASDPAFDLRAVVPES